ncbi:MAG: gephyrin-like molybdotransferase Glp [Chloroflexota bacterium]
MKTLLSVSEALERLLKNFEPVTKDVVSLEHSSGRALAEEIYASDDLPSFDASGMDGFALRAEDVIRANVDSPISLKVVEDIPAGAVPQCHISTGQAARIMTGAPLPDGADAVIPVEYTDFQTRKVSLPAPSRVRIFRSVGKGDFVRPKGQDIRAGEKVLSIGIRLRPQDIGLLAMLGKAQIEVYRLPRVAFFSSGDELVPVGVPLTFGKIYNSNSYMLMASIQKYGGEVVNLGIVPDDPHGVRMRFERAVAEGVDLILSSAGVSVGAYDYVRQVIEQHGDLQVWGVNMRPGKPIAFGNYRGVPFIGLPGNPSSAFVGMEVFVRPVLYRLGGVMGWQPLKQVVFLEEPLTSDGRESYLRGMVYRRQDGRWAGRLTGLQVSGNLISLVQANALLIIPAGVQSVPAGTEVEAWFLEGT